MLMPSIFGENLLDDFFGEPFGGYDYSESGLMTTDVKDTDKGYEVTMNMPGVKKEDVKADMDVADICAALEKGMTEITLEGVTGDEITWTEDGEPNKAPKAVEIKDGAYTAME